MRRNVRAMPRSAIVPKLSALAFACALASSSVYAQAPGTAPAQPTTPVAPAQAAPATPPPAATGEPSAAAKEAARVAYTRGQTAFSAGRYDEARIAFEEAFAAMPNPIVLLSVAESRVKLGQLREAVAAFTRYLELRPDAPDRAEVEAKIKSLSSTPAFVTVTSVPPGAQITLDQNTAPQTAPAQLELAPGKHELKYALPGYASGSEVVEVDPGARYELEIKLTPAAPAPPPAAAAAAAINAPMPTAPVDNGPPTAALWITGGLGAAGIITGSVLGVLALQAESDFNQHPTEETADKGERLALFADVSFGIGIMAIATLAVLVFTHDAPGSGNEEASPEAARLELVPQVSHTGASATARVRF